MSYFGELFDAKRAAFEKENIDFAGERLSGDVLIEAGVEMMIDIL